MTETQKLIKQVFNDYEYDDEHFITTPHIENLEKILLQKVAEMQANLVYAVAMPKIAEILKGIDKTETEEEGGWWETSVGAKFGKGKLEQIEDIFSNFRG